jgi:hypothetical protein
LQQVAFWLSASRTCSDYCSQPRLAIHNPRRRLRSAWLAREWKAQRNRLTQMTITIPQELVTVLTGFAIVAAVALVVIFVTK